MRLPRPTMTSLLTGVFALTLGAFALAATSANLEVDLDWSAAHDNWDYSTKTKTASQSFGDPIGNYNFQVEISGVSADDLKGLTIVPFKPSTGDGSTESAGFAIVSPRDAASGQATGKRQHRPIRVRAYLDQAHPISGITIYGAPVPAGWNARENKTFKGEVTALEFTPIFVKGSTSLVSGVEYEANTPMLFQALCTNEN